MILNNDQMATINWLHVYMYVHCTVSVLFLIVGVMIFFDWIPEDWKEDMGGDGGDPPDDQLTELPQAKRDEIT